MRMSSAAIDSPTGGSGNQNGQNSSRLAIIQCSGESIVENWSKNTTMTTSSTLRSDLSSVCGRKRRLLNRFRRRTPASELWTSAGHLGGTVVKVGSDSGSVRSGSWRMHLASLPSQTSTLSSLKSGRTVPYEEFEAAYAATSDQFRSVIDVESSSEQYKSVVTVDSDNGAPLPVPHDINVIVENEEEEEAEGDATRDVQDITRISVECTRNEEWSEKPETSSNRRSRHERSERFEEDPNRDGVPFFLPEPHVLPPHLGPLPPLLIGPRPPWPPPGFVEAATPPVELTRWRLNQSFDPNPGEPAMEHRRRSNFLPRSSRATNHSPRDFNGGHVLTAEDLPRIFPAPMVPPPFARFEEDFSDEEVKECCGGWRVSQVTLVRSFIAIISLVGMACVIVGIVLGALTVSGTARLTLCLLMIGVGAVLITVSGIAWRLTSMSPSSSTTCWSIFGFGRPTQSSLYGASAGRNPYLRVRSPNGQLLHPFAGFFHPEFAWRPPPPSYQASVREEYLQQFFDSRPNRMPIPVATGSPPPMYRPHSREQRTSVDVISREPSRPPSYRSQESIPEIVVEGRPFSRQHITESAENSVPSSGEGVATVSTERISVDDRQRLLQHQSGFPSTSGDANRINISVDGDLVSVIDCSTAVPVGFRVSDSQRDLANLASRKRPYAHSGFQYRGSLPPPLACSSPCSSGRQGIFIVTGGEGEPEVCYMPEPILNTSLIRSSDQSNDNLELVAGSSSCYV